jgi:hypothetical protein
VKTRVFRGLSLLRRQLEPLRAALALALWPTSRRPPLHAAKPIAMRLAAVLATGLGAAAIPAIGSHELVRAKPSVAAPLVRPAAVRDTGSAVTVMTASSSVPIVIGKGTIRVKTSISVGTAPPVGN